MKKLDSLMSKTKFIFFYMLICFVMLYMSACTTPTQTSANKSVKRTALTQIAASSVKNWGIVLNRIVLFETTA